MTLLFGLSPACAQQPRRITDVSLTATDSLRLVTEPISATPDLLLLESADNPLGPWEKVSEFQRTNAANGYEFLTPRKPYYPQRFYRIGLLGPGPLLPFIRFISPNDNVRPGQLVTLLGANFAATPAGNAVRFERPGQLGTATVTQVGTNYLMLTVPTNLLTSSTGLFFRVTVTTSEGTGNGVGCKIYSSPATVPTFSLRPTQSDIIQAPGTGTETLVIGGGVLPYRLVPQSSNDLSRVVAQLDGPVLHVTAVSNVPFASITVRVEDSSVPPRQASSSVTVQTPINPTLTTTFHTLLAGSAPGFTAIAEFNTLQPEQLEMRLQNAQIDLRQLQPGSVLGLLKLYYSSSIYGFQQLRVTDVSADRAKFDVVSLDGGGVTTVAQGELIQSPPTIVINALGQKPASLMPATVDEEFIFSDNVFRLPVNAGEKFSLITTFTSVSAREDKYLPQRNVVTHNFTTTTNGIPGAPRIERLLPVHGEVFRIVTLRGTGFDANPTNNEVTFAGVDGTREPAEIISQTNGQIVVVVPRGAITGPVRLAVNGKVSNDFSFFVRFHPDVALVFETFNADTPTAPRLLQQQPVNEGETLGEVPVQTVITTLDKGRLALAGVTNNQQVGITIQLNFSTHRASTNVIIYKGRETPAPQRHIFEVLTSVGSSFPLARIYALDNPDGNGVIFEISPGTFPFSAGIMWDHQFTRPIYGPPAAAGTDVAIRMETVSQPWMSVPGSEMRLIENSTLKVK